MTKYLRWPAHQDRSVTESVVGSWIPQYENPAFYQWAIVPKDLMVPISTISVVDQNEKTSTLHIGYCIGGTWWHKGYTSEALQTILPFPFGEVKANRVES